jgi:undecaprenyl-diphosphatase
MPKDLRDWIDWAGGHGVQVLVAVLLLVGGVLGFILIADRVQEGRTQHFDDWAIHRLSKPDVEPAPPPGTRTVPVGPSWLREVGRDLTALGGVTVLTLVTFAVAGYLLMARKFGAMWLVLAATVGGLVISSLLKHAFQRERPNVTHFSDVFTSSFPSGHSMLSAVVYLTLGSLLARLSPRRRIKAYFLVTALLLTFLVGVSRVYMGVHYPTDVLAGWTAGLVWAVLCWLVARYLQRRRLVEPDAEPEPDGDQSRDEAGRDA